MAAPREPAYDRRMKTLCSDAGIAGLAVRELPLPEPGPGEVRVRVRASAINPADQKVLAGEFTGNFLHGKAKPLVLGYDLAGTVEAVGAGADLAVGDEVFGFLPYTRATKRGAFAEAVIAPAKALAKRPEGLSPTVACALATAGVTALQALRDIGNVKTGDKVLVIGASGGVGSLAVGIAAHLGAEVTGLCSAGAAELVKSLGATHVIDRSKGDPFAHGGPYNAILDAAAAYSWSATRGRLAPGGAYIATLPSPGLFAGAVLARLSGQRCAFVSTDPRRADFELLAGWVVDGSLRVPIDATFPVRDARAAIERMGKGGMKGRVVIEVEGGF